MTTADLGRRRGGAQAAILLIATCWLPTACGASGHGAGSAATQPHRMTVRSTLQGRHVLPLRIRWRVVTSAAPGSVAEVRFLIDGALAWTEHRPPYVYGADGNWLVTSFLRPGLHVFTAAVRTFDGGSASRSVRATVRRAPAPPAALAGTWSHVVTAGDVRNATSGQPPPPGRWRLRITQLGWQLTDPRGGGLAFDVAYRRRRHLQMRPTIERPPYPNPTNGGFCRDTDPIATWTFTVGRHQSLLHMQQDGQDPCGDRIAILAGTWTRIGDR